VESEAHLETLAQDLVDFGLRCGAEEVEVAVGHGYEFAVEVRLGSIEKLTEAGSKGLSARVIKEKKTASFSSEDLDRDTLERLVRDAVRRADLANPDEYAGLPEEAEGCVDDASLQLYDPEIAGLSSRKKIDLALQTERIALKDERIVNSHGAVCGTNEGWSLLVNSKGFRGHYASTSCYLGIGLQAGETDTMVEDYWYSSKRHFRELDPPEKVARTCVERTVRQLGARKIETQSVPVVLEPLMTGELLGFLFLCVSGTSIYRKSSFLAGRLGEKIGDDHLTVIDDGRIPRGLGSSPFDGEGVPTRKTVVVEKGVLRSFLCDTYAARKLGLRSTGNSSGSGVGPHNFHLVPGEHTPGEIIRTVEKGLLLTRTIGQGLNPVTGDISRGAYGLWIDRGEIAYPVSEVTVSGNLGEILRDMEMIGNDLEFRASISGPTVKIGMMTVSGS